MALFSRLETGRARYHFHPVASQLMYANASIQKQCGLLCVRWSHLRNKVLLCAAGLATKLAWRKLAPASAAYKESESLTS